MRITANKLLSKINHGEISIKDLHDKAGLNTNTIYYIQTGSKIKFEYVSSICDALNMQPDALFEFIPEEKKVVRKHSSNTQKIAQYDIEGNLVTTYDGVREAARSLDVVHTGINQVALGKRKIAHGFIWRYFIDEPMDKILIN